MQIILTNRYYIDVDKLNCTLKQKFIGKKKDKSPKESEKVCGYYKNLDGAIEKFLKLNQIDLMGDQSLELRSYVNQIDAINQRTVQEIKKNLEGNKE